MVIEYVHSQNLHTKAGPRSVVTRLFGAQPPRSVLDIGCGTGTWLAAIQDLGVQDFLGIDGVEIAPEELLIPRTRFRLQDLSAEWNLGRSFELALCLEVGEHLPASAAKTLVDSITRHADHVIFSAACPGQPGQHHVNCRPPEYWQGIFNQNGFACFDDVRWAIWNDENVEPWYRQNIFSATKKPDQAGKEPRLPFVIHPAMLAHGLDQQIRADEVRRIESGAMRITWYPAAFAKAVVNKVRRIAANTKQSRQ